MAKNIVTVYKSTECKYTFRQMWGNARQLRETLSTKAGLFSTNLGSSFGKYGCTFTVVSTNSGQPSNIFDNYGECRRTGGFSTNLHVTFVI